MEYLLNISLVSVEPYLLGFAAGVFTQRLYTGNAWRFKGV